MAYTTGTASNHYDLLVRLKNWLTATAGWTLNEFTDDANAATAGAGTVVSVYGPGAGASQRVQLNIRTVTYVGLSSYSWEVQGALSWTTGLAWGSQLGSSGSSYLNMWNASIPYWFYANDRRIIVVAKCSTVYVSLYAGFFLPWANPTQHTFPFYIAGDWSAATAFSTANSGRRMCCDPSSGYVRTANGLWVPIRNQSDGSSNNNPTDLDVGAWAKVWPWHVGNSGGEWDNGGLDNILPTRQSEHFIWPSVVLNGNGPQFGSLDGVYATGGSGLSAEAAVTVGARNFRAFQNVHRNSGDDIFLVEEI